MMKNLLLSLLVFSSAGSAYALDVKSCQAEGRVNGEAFSLKVEEFKIKNEKPYENEDYHFTFASGYKLLPNNYRIYFHISVNHAVDRISVIGTIDDLTNMPEGGSSCNPKFCKAVQFEMGGKAGPMTVRSDLITAKGENANFRLSCDVIADQINIVEQNLHGK